MKVKIAKWGNSLGLRLPKELTQQLGLAAGSVVEIGRDKTRLIAETALGSPVPRYRLEDLLADMDRLGRKNEPQTVDWGPDVGSEIIDDAYSRGEITLDDLRKPTQPSKPSKAPRRRKTSHASRRRRHSVG